MNLSIFGVEPNKWYANQKSNAAQRLLLPQWHACLCVLQVKPPAAGSEASADASSSGGCHQACMHAGSGTSFNQSVLEDDIVKATHDGVSKTVTQARPPPPLPPLHHVAVMILNHYTMMPRHVAMCLGIIIQWLSVMTATRCHPPAPPITHLRTSLRLSTNLKRGTALVPSLLGRCARYGGSWSPNSACMWMAPR